MVCEKLHICHDLVLYQNVNGYAYSTPLRHEASDVDHKMVMLGIGWYHNTFSLIFVQLQNYSEYDTLCLSILFYWIFSVLALINESMFTMIIRQMFLELFSHTGIIFCVQECTRIY